MPPLRIRFYTCLLLLTIGVPFSGGAQDEASDEKTTPEPAGEFVGVGVVPKLSIARKDLPNFLSDDRILSLHGVDSEMDPTKQPPLEGIFSVGSGSSRFQVLWDPVSCRLLGIRDLDVSLEESAPDPGAETNGESGEAPAETEEASSEEEESTEPSLPSPFVFVASGAAPFENTSGGGGDSRFFGMRLVEGKPEFLYQRGTLLVEERLWLENGGQTLQQQFSLREMDSPLVLELPASWKTRATADRGDWKGETLTVPKDKSGELRIAYRLATKEEELD